MRELSRYLYLAGAAPFLILGVAHAFATPLAPGQRRGLSLRDVTLEEGLARSRVLLTGRTNVWLAWVGFNLSHSLGAVLFGAVVLLTGRSAAVFQSEAPLFLPLALLVSGTYVALAVTYWFRTPIIGTVVSLVLFLLSSVLFLLGKV
jgi:hypothetical protein